MNAKSIVLVCALCLLGFGAALRGAEATTATELVRFEMQHSQVRIEPVTVGEQSGLAVIFEGTDDLHFYAKPETAPAPDLKLTIKAQSDAVAFGPAVLPPWKMFTDSLGQKIEVYVGDFTAFVPFAPGAAAVQADVKVTVSGIACTSALCLPPFEKTLTATIDLAGANSWRQASLETVAAQSAAPAASEAQSTRPAILPYSTPVYYLLAILAGISINIMPCVLPVLPLILMRLIEQSKQSSSKRIAAGLAFCGGVILFFAVFALVSAIINLSTGAVLDLNSLFRYPAAVIVLFLAIVFFGLAMLDVVALSLPSAVIGRQNATSGLAGSAGMGFFAAILSTPCSGALLGFVLVWAQTQPLLVSSLAIVLMGVGMALPYAVIVLVPSLLARVPKPGAWMDVFKKSTGFLLFFIAAKLTLAALPKDQLLNVLMYGIIFSFCVWMWGKWVDFSTPAGKKWTVRLVALAIAVGAGLWLLPTAGLPSGPAVDWQAYDADLVQQATAQNRPVVLKFTADWCTNCKVVERKVFRDPDVVTLMEARNVLAIKADTTLNTYPATVALKQVYGEAGNVPVTIVLGPDGAQEKLRGIFAKESLIEILRALPEGPK